MKISILGIRGLPSTYSGYETFISELAPRLVKRGHTVTVYCRGCLYKKRVPEWKGIRLMYLPSAEHKAVGTLLHSMLAMLHASISRPDMILSVNAATGWFSIIAWLFRVPNITNVDGMEWLRPKWNSLGKFMFLNGARLACRFSAAVVTDAEEMHRLYARQFGIDSIDIAYGANIEDSEHPEVLARYGLKPGRYLLVASRLVPDNNADLIVDAFTGTDTDLQLAIAGGADYKGNTKERAFLNKLKGMSNERVKFLGHVDSYEHIKELHCNCYAYVHGHQFGGINPSLLKALGFGNMILALNTPFNAEVLDGGKYGILYEKNRDDLRGKLQSICDSPARAADFRAKARDRIRERFTWDHITDQYEALMQGIGRGAPAQQNLSQQGI